MVIPADLGGKVIKGNEEYSLCRNISKGFNVYLSDKLRVIKVFEKGGSSSNGLNVYNSLKRELAAQKLITASGSQENVLSLLEVIDENDYTFLVYPYLPHGTLDEKLNPISLHVENVKSLSVKVCNGLEYIHQLGIVHRDIKPSNILLGNNEEEFYPVIFDFNICYTKELQHMEESGHVLGTPYYMPPEIASGSVPDRRSDLYSLGATMFRLLTGRNIFDGGGPNEVIIKHLTQPAPKPSWFNSDVTKQLDNIVLRALEKDTEKRYQSAAELREDLIREGLNSSVKSKGRKLTRLFFK